MSDYVPSTEDVRSDATQLMNADDFDRWLEQVKTEARAGVLSRPLPTRETIARALDQTGAFCGTCSYEPGGFYNNCDDCRRVLDSYADAVLALLKGQDS